MKGITSKAIAIAALGGLSISSLLTGSAEAATATANMAVNASVAGSCTVAPATLNFGPYAAAAASTANSSVQVTCSSGTNALVSLNQGANNNRASAFGTRALNNGTNYLGYEIYTDSGLTTTWNTTNTVPVTSTGTPVTLTAYGRIPAGQTAVTGSYNDNVGITVTF